MKKKVVMLPTNVGSNLYLKITDGYQGLEYNPYSERRLNTWHKPQHLYFVSEDKVNEGDWCVQMVSGTPTKVVKVNKSDLIHVEFYKKIISTTDRTLKTDYDGKSPITTYWGGVELHKIPQEFIERFINDFNKGNVITEVNIEFEDRPYYGDIDKPKDTWTRDEVIKLIKKSKEDFPLHRGIQLLDTDLDKWIEENI